MKPTWGKVTPAKPDRAGQPADIISFPTDGRRQASTSAGRFAATDEDFRVLVDGSIEGIVIHRENEVLYINDAFASILGYETAELVALGTVDHIAADHDIDRLLGYRRARLRGEAAPDHYEYQAIRKDGSLVWLENFVRVIDWHGAPAVKSTAIDITKRKLAEADLAESERRYRELVEASIEGILIIAGDRPVFVNSAFAFLFGYSQAEVLSFGSLDVIVHPEDRKRMQGYRIARLKGDDAPARYEFRGLRKDGGEIWVSASATGTTWRGMPAVQAIVIDVSALKTAHQEAAQAEAFLQTVVDAIPAAVTVKDANRRYILVNRFLCDRRGIRRSELLGRRAILPPLAARQTKANDELVLAEGKPLPYMEASQILDGAKTDWLQTKVPIRNLAGDVDKVLTVAFDVTEHKAVENELRESEARYRSLVDQAPVAIVIHIAGEVRFANAQVVQLLGARNASEIIGHDVLKLAHPSDRDAIRARMRAVMKDRSVAVSKEQRWLRLDGSVVDVEVSGGFVRWEGEPAIQVVARDISERKAIERELRESETRYKTLVSQSPDAIIINERGIITFANDAARDLFRSKTIDRLVGCPAARFVHPDDLPRVERRVHKVRSKGGTIALLEGKMICMDGTIADVEITGSQVTWNGRRAVQMIARDVTERQRTNRALRLTELAVDRAADAVFWINSKGSIRHVNAAAKEMLGYSRRGLKSMCVWDINPDMTAKLWRTRFNEIRRLGSDVIHDVSFLTKDGEFVPVEIVNNYVKDDDDEYTFAFVRDTSVRRATEAALRERETQLAHLMRVRTMGEMATALAHQLGQPLNAITNYVRGTVRRLNSGDRDSPEMFEAMDNACVEAERAGRIVREIAQFVSTSEPRRAPIKINDIVAAAVELTHGEAIADGIEIGRRLQRDLPNVEADAIHIEQVLLNLIRNGIEVMRVNAGGPRQLNIRSQLRDDVVQIDVRDSGPPVAPDAIEAMFEPFQSGKPDGMGMGLAISRTIIEAHKGTLWATRNRSRGLTFHFTLPIESKGSRHG